jgi:uncharacterized membrane protein
LDNYEKTLLQFLLLFEKNGTIDLEDLKNKMSSYENAYLFKEMKENLNEKLKELPTKDIFIEKGHYYAKLLGIFGILSILFVNIFDTWKFPFLSGGIFICILNLILGVIYIILPKKIFGRYTQKGAEMDAKWKSFSKFLSDFSLIKQYPIDSIIIWQKYLPYAISLGVGKKAIENLKALSHGRDIEGELDNLYVAYISCHYFNAIDFAARQTLSPRTSGSGIGGFSIGGGGGGAR